MKFSKYFMMAGAAFMLAACSSEEPIGQAPGSEVLDGAEVYASFRINMVSPDGTRAPMDVTDEVGDAENEYLIDNGKVLIFGVLNEDMGGHTDVDELTLDERVKARFIVAADLENMGTATAGTGSIKDTYKDVKAKFAKGTFSSANYSAYLAVCILNCEDAASGITSFLPKQGESFADWGTRENMNSNISFTKDGQTYFKMTNAPVVDKNMKNDHRVLEIVDPSLVFENESDLEGKDAAAKFTVQRLAAKITVKSKESSKSFTVGTEGYEGTATLTAWATDNTRKNTFPVQNVWYDTEVPEFKAFIDLDKSWLHSATRCFWGYSQYYTEEYGTDTDNAPSRHFNTVVANQITTWSDDPAYIRENMVAYNKMAKGNTTRVIVKATYKLQGQTDAISFVKIDNVAKLYTTGEFCAAVKEHYLDIKNEGKAEADKDKGEAVEVTLNKKTGNAYTFGEFISIKDGDNTLTYDDADADNGYTIINRVAGRMGVYDVAAEEVFLYEDGVCYYPIYVQHFAKDQEAAGILADKINILDDYTPAHTGRYGILRNNWYELSINSVTGPGYPNIPPRIPDEPVDGPADKTNKFLNVEINILNWAKHTQGVDL